MHFILRIAVLGFALSGGLFAADLVVDDFKGAISSKKHVDSFSAPTETHYVAFLRHDKLNTRNTIGGTRNGSLNIKKGDWIKALIDTKTGTCQVTYAKGAGGWAFLSYSGNNSGERRSLSLSLDPQRFSEICIALREAPPHGRLSVTLHSGKKFAKHPLPVTGPAVYRYPLDSLNEIDLKKVDGITVELHVEESPEEQAFVFERIYVSAPTLTNSANDEPNQRE